MRLSQFVCDMNLSVCLQMQAAKSLILLLFARVIFAS
jgi:hypothetical protein